MYRSNWLRRFIAPPAIALAFFDGTADGGTGATPAAGATPAPPATGQQPAAGATPAAGSNPPQPTTGDQPLGEGGLRALEAERAARRTAEEQARAATAELDKLRGASQTDHDKALEQAKRDATAAANATWREHIRTVEVRSQLRAAGLTADKTLALAVKAPEFAALKVTDTGDVEGLATAVEAFRKDYPELFGATTRPQGGTWDGSAGGGTGQQPATLTDAVMAQMSTNRR